LVAYVVVLSIGCADDEAEPGTFGAECSVNEDCNSPMICFAFMDGSKCTVECPAGGGACPEGSSGCNMMGVCKTK
jgi:hypothetical protein